MSQNADRPAEEIEVDDDFEWVNAWAASTVPHVPNAALAQGRPGADVQSPEDEAGVGAQSAAILLSPKAIAAPTWSWQRIFIDAMKAQSAADEAQVQPAGEVAGARNALSISAEAVVGGPAIAASAAMGAMSMADASRTLLPETLTHPATRRFFASMREGEPEEASMREGEPEGAGVRELEPQGRSVREREAEDDGLPCPSGRARSAPETMTPSAVVPEPREAPAHAGNVMDDAAAPMIAPLPEPVREEARVELAEDVGPAMPAPVRAPELVPSQPSSPVAETFAIAPDNNRLTAEAETPSQPDAATASDALPRAEVMPQVEPPARPWSRWLALAAGNAARWPSLAAKPTLRPRSRKQSAAENAEPAAETAQATAVPATAVLETMSATAVPATAVVEATPATAVPATAVVEATPATAVPATAMLETTADISAPATAAVERASATLVPAPAVVEATPVMPAIVFAPSHPAITDAGARGAPLASAQLARDIAEIEQARDVLNGPATEFKRNLRMLRARQTPVRRWTRLLPILASTLIGFLLGVALVLSIAALAR